MSAAAQPVPDADEGRHEPGVEPLWNESWYFDVAAADGSFGGWVRMGLYPNLGATWYMALFAGPGRPLAAVVDVTAPVPDGGDLSVPVLDGRGLTRCTAPFTSWHVSGEATGLVVDDPEAMYREGEGTPARIAHDLVWTDAGEAYPYRVTTRYEVPCHVQGTVTIGDEVISVDGRGQRDHSWGVRDWWAFGWCWSAGWFDDGSAMHATDIRLPGSSLAFGYRQHDGAITPATGVRASEEVRPNGFPTSGRIEVDGTGFAFGVEPLAIAPVLLRAPDGRTARFPRALCRFTDDDGRTGHGWTEWNQP